MAKNPNELTDDEKKALVDRAMVVIMPIAEKHELNTATGIEALFEAFQAGVQFSIRETKAIDER